MSKTQSQPPPDLLSRAHDWRLACFDGLAFALPFVFAVCCLGSSVGWLDSPELAAAAFSLGISHPPGHPAFVLFSHLFTLQPVGSVPFRMGLCSAFCLGMAVWVAYRAALQLLALVFGEECLALRFRVLTLLSLLIGCLTYTVMLQAVRPEVYTFHLMLAFGVFERCLAAWRGVRLAKMYDGNVPEAWGVTRCPRVALVQGAWLFGIGLANHHYLMLLVLPGVLWLLYQLREVWCQQLLWKGFVAALASVVLIGLSSYLFMPVRSAQKPQVHWGKANTAKGFWWQISAQAWQKSVNPNWAKQPVPKRLMLLLTLYVEQFGFWLLLALIGLYVLFRSFPPVAVLLLLWGGANIMGRALMRVARLDADLHGYLTTSMLLVGWLLAICFVFFWRQMEGAPVRPLSTMRERLFVRLGQGGVFLAAALPFALLPEALVASKPSTFSLTQVDQREQVGPLRWGRLMEEPLPYGSVLVTSYYQSGFLRWYRQVVERHRPDIRLIQRNLLVHPTIAAADAERDPKWRSILTSFATNRALFFTELRKVSRQRTVCFEWFRDIPQSMARTLVPVGLFFCWLPEQTAKGTTQAKGADDQLLLEQQRYFWQEVYALYGKHAHADRPSRHLLLWTHFQHAQFYLQTERWKLGLAEAKMGLALSPKSRSLKAFIKLFKQKIAAQ